MPVVCIVPPASPAHCMTTAPLAAQVGASTNEIKPTGQVSISMVLVLEVIAKLKPEYVRLSENSLLEKCLHGKTQNQNEGLNGMVWQRVPKEVYVGREILEMGLYDAVAHFNIGCSVVLKLFDALGIPSGRFTETGCKQEDQARVHLSQRKSLDNTKNRRKVLRGLKKRKDDKRKEADGVNYASGYF